MPESKLVPESKPVNESKFVYVTFIRTTPEKLWEAITDPNFSRRYWCGITVDSTFQPGAAWKLVKPDGGLTDSGEILEVEPLKRLVIKWRNEFIPEMHADGYSTCTMQLEPSADMVKFTVIHSIDKAESKLIAGVSGGWPIILSSLKSMLETGEPLEVTTRWREPVKK